MENGEQGKHLYMHTQYGSNIYDLVSYDILNCIIVCCHVRVIYQSW